MAGWFEAFANFARGAEPGFDRYQALRQLDTQNQLRLRQQQMQEQAQKVDNEYRQRQMEQLDQALLGVKQKSFEDIHSIGSDVSPEDVSYGKSIGLGSLFKQLPQYGDVQNVQLPTSIGHPLTTGAYADMAPNTDDRFMYEGTPSQQTDSLTKQLAQRSAMINLQKVMAEAQKTQSEANVNNWMAGLFNGGQGQAPQNSVTQSGQQPTQSGYGKDFIGPIQPGSNPIPPPLGSKPTTQVLPQSNGPVGAPSAGGGVQFSPDDLKEILGHKMFGVSGLGKPEPVQTVNVKGPDGRIIPFNTRTQEPINLPQGYSVYERPNSTQINMPGPDTMNLATAAVLEHRMSPSQAVAYYAKGIGAASGNFARELMTNVQKNDPKFDFQAAESNYQYGKAPGTQTTVRFIDNIQKTIPVVEGVVEKLNLDNKLRGANIAELWSKKQLSDETYANFNLVQTMLADEFAKILQGGGTGNQTSDAKLKQAQSVLDGTMNVSQWKTILPTVKELLAIRRNTLTGGTYMESKQFGGSTNAFPPKGTTRNVGGVDYVSDGTQFVPVKK